MRNFVISAGTAAAMAAAVLAGFLPVPADAGQTPGRRHVVEIRNLEFNPRELTVAPGDTVVWVNRDIIPHTITADDTSWDSDFVDRDGQWQMVVREDTGEAYFCQYHPSMRGRLRIVRR